LSLGQAPWKSAFKIQSRTKVEFDLVTRHYKLDKLPADEKRKAIEQAKKAWEAVLPKGYEVIYKDDVGK